MVADLLEVVYVRAVTNEKEELHPCVTLPILPNHSS